MSSAVTWLQRNLGVDVTGEWARHIHLNVGGVLYTTRRHTLRRFNDHPLFGPILTGHAQRCEDGSFLIDRDAVLFRYIIAYLRSGTLAVPDSFAEWEMLLEEVRYFQLTELEALVLDRFEYQRAVFRRQLPHGVYVLWPAATTTADASRAGASAEETQNAAKERLVSLKQEAAPLPARTGSSPLRTANTGNGEESHDQHTGGGRGSAMGSAAASPPSPSTCNASSSASTTNSQSIRIVPPLPGLVVGASDSGRTVVFREGQVLQDLDQLVTVLLTAYGYVVQHWDDARGRVLLTLPGSL